MEYFGIVLAIIYIIHVGAETPWNLKEVDFIVVGAGAAGAVVASRLAEDSESDVALLEAGGEPSYFTQIPYFSVGPFNGDLAWAFKTEKQESAFLSFKDQKVGWPRGKGLGGTMLVNAMFYTRGSRHDYDHWSMLGNLGWDYHSVLPYFLKSEDYQAPLLNEKDALYHSQGGPLSVSVPPYRTPLADAFVNAGKELGYSAADFNSETMLGVSNPVFTIRNGTRWTTNNAYIQPALKRKNFHLITHAVVSKVVFDDKKRANGVIFVKDGTKWLLKARKEVILSSGSLNSPHILMLSGVGPKEVLEKYQIPTVVDLPGVGQNLQDHMSLATMAFSVDRNVGFKSEGETTPETLELWERKRQGPLTVPIRCEGMSFLRTKYADPNNDYPDIEIVMSQPPRPPLPIDPEDYNRAFSPECGKDMLYLIPVLMHPKSVGYLTLQSADPSVPPLFQPRYLTHDDDVKVMVEGIKMALKLADTEAFKQYGVRWFARKLAACEHIQDFDDSYWECVLRHYAIPYHHQAGTCKMGPKSDKMAVVDSELKVYGVSGLRVVDISISPHITTGHTVGPAVMIGEKAADMIEVEWKPNRDKLSNNCENKNQLLC